MKVANCVSLSQKVEGRHHSIALNRFHKHVIENKFRCFIRSSYVISLRPGTCLIAARCIPILTHHQLNREIRSVRNTTVVSILRHCRLGDSRLVEQFFLTFLGNFKNDLLSVELD